MRLYPLTTGRLAINIARVSRKLRLDVVVTRAERFDCVVVIANGTPDDYAFTIICYHLNGERIAGILKPPGKTRLEVLDLLPSYSKVGKIMILMDQEEQDVDKIFEGAEKKLINAGFRISDKVEEVRLSVYECEFGGRGLKIVLVVNGLDEVKTKKHAIEDHLLKAAKTLGVEIGSFENSKDAWRTLDRGDREYVFRRLKEDKRIVEDVFPQQVRGCKYLD